MRVGLPKFVLALLLAGTATVSAATITTQLDPPVVNVGETSTLTVTVPSFASFGELVFRLEYLNVV